MLIADIDDRSAGWLYVAVNDLRERMARNGQQPPPSLNEFADWCFARARQGQAGSTLAEIDGLADDRQVTRMTLTIDETAGALNVSRSSVKRLIHDGLVRTVSIAGAVRIRVTDLDSYVADLEPVRPTSAERNVA